MTDHEIQTLPIRGLSFWQPFGSLMLYGKEETRLWNTPYRGLVLICTTKAPLLKQPLKKRAHITFTAQNSLDIDSWRFVDNARQFPTFGLNGYAIAIGRLHDSRWSNDNDNTFFDHPRTAMPLYTHIYRDVKQIEPFPIKGGQGWFKITPEIRSKIKLL